MLCRDHSDNIDTHALSEDITDHFLFRELIYIHYFWIVEGKLVIGLVIESTIYVVICTHYDSSKTPNWNIADTHTRCQ